MFGLSLVAVSRGCSSLLMVVAPLSVEPRLSAHRLQGLQHTGSEALAHQLSLRFLGFPGSKMVKNLPASAGEARDMVSVPGSGISPGVGNGNPLQYSCLENSMDRGDWWATVHGVANSRTQLNESIYPCGIFPGKGLHSCLLHW